MMQLTFLKSVLRLISNIVSQKQQYVQAMHFNLSFPKCKMLT